ncbi:MAG: DNRLRE domain-containing protein, partial [Anaerolineae bacterium]|nr:DNRLRE domain-containing protein [Anaerolineae bacterium]
MKRKVAIVLAVLSTVALRTPLAGMPVVSGHTSVASPRAGEVAAPLAPLDVTTLTAVSDAYVASVDPLKNFGGVSPLYVGNLTTTAANRALLRFSLSTVPANAVIDSAVFRAYLAQAPTSPPLNLDVGVYRITQSWTEGTVAWTGQPAAVSIGKVTPVGMSARYYEWEVTELAQAWLASAATNFGLELRSEIEGTFGWRAFASREAATNRPQLVVTYHLPLCSDLQEPNDSFAAPYQISAGTEVLGCIPTPSDVDTFRFDVAPYTAVSVELFSLPANYDLYLYSPTQALLDSSANGGTTSEVVTYTTGASGGQYYASVQSGGEYDLYESYALKLTLTAVPVYPDLVINDVWAAASQVCYEIANPGLATAAAGHDSALRIDGVLVATDAVPSSLAPGATLQRCFAGPWLCTSAADTINVCADHLGEVGESNEANNCRQESWACDTTAPVIVTGPTVTGITSSGATVSWTTDEDADSTVAYGRTAGVLDGEVGLPMLVQAHTIGLSGLLPSATYRYLVSSADAAGNVVTSTERYFTTGPVSSPPPSITAVTMTRALDKALHYAIGATLPVTLNVEHVEFTMDGRLLGKVYAGKPGAVPGLYEFPLIPAALGIQREGFFSEHEFEAVAVGFGGLTGRFGLTYEPPYECTDIHVEMDSPTPDATFYYLNGALPAGTTVPIEVYAWDVTEEECNVLPWQQRAACLWEASQIERIDIAASGEQICSLAGHEDAYAVYTCDWDASGLGAGVYGIRVDVTDDADCSQTLFRDVTVEQGEAELTVTRDVTRNGTTFEVALTIANRGHADFRMRRVEDHVSGFQPIAASVDLPNWRHVQVSSNCATTGEACAVQIDTWSDVDAGAILLGPGDSVVLSYEAVPVMLPDPVEEDQAIGDEPVQVLEPHRAEGPTFDRPCGRLVDGTPLADAVSDARAESDYLAVTRPESLFELYGEGSTNAFLSDIAVLVQHRNGILGYLVGEWQRFSFIADDTIWEWGTPMQGS